MGKIQKIAIRLKKITNLRLNKMYKICEQEGLTAQEIEYVKYLVNECNGL